MLRSRGLAVHSPTLTGLGDRAHLLSPGVNFELHVEDLIRAVDGEDLNRFVLVGHSYAGLLVGALAARMPERVAGILFLDAFVPQPCHSLFDLISREERDHLREAAASNEPNWLLPPFEPAGYGVTEAADSAWLSSKLDPMPIACFEQPVNYDEAILATVPQSYVFATRSHRDRFSRFATGFRSHAQHGYHEIASGHDMMLTHPADTADIIELEARRMWELAS
jgi:pimeloyl-ACP methyl ester carboxylesterase